MRRQQLTESQIASLFDPPTDQRESVRYYTFSEADIAIIRRCRGDHSRLGYALMLCRAIAALREVEDVPDHLLAHLSPLGWEHVNLTGDYVWSRADQRTVNADGYRPLRMASEAALPAA